MLKLFRAAISLLVAFATLSQAWSHETENGVEIRQTQQMCQIKFPRPATGTCAVLGTLSKPSVLKNSIATSATTYQMCIDGCHAVSGCQSFSWDRTAVVCTFYRKDAYHQGFKKNRSAHTLFVDRICLECDCNPTFQNGDWETGSTMPWAVTGDQGFATRIISPGNAGSKYALKSTPPVGTSDFSGNSYISQQYTWCAHRNYTISFDYKMVNRGESYLMVTTADVDHPTQVFLAGNDGSRTWESVSVTYFSNADDGHIQFQFQVFQQKQIFEVDNIAITLQGS